MSDENLLTNQLPSTWAMTRLKQVATIRYGKALAADSREKNGKIPVFGSSTSTGLHDVAFHHQPSIVIGRKGSVGSVQYVETPFWPIDTVFFLDEILPCVDLRFLAAALSYFGLERYKIVVGVPGINRGDLENFQFPLPPLSEQQRIVEILQEVEEINHLRAEAVAKTAELIPAMFNELFGDIGNNTKGWPIVPVSTFVESFQGGKSLTGIEGDFDTLMPRVLKISAVTSGFLVPSESKALPLAYEPPDAHYIKAGDLLITRANTEELVGATALVGEKYPANLVLPDKIWRFIWKKGFDGTPGFVWALFQEQATRWALSNIASGSGGSMKNISMKKLMQMRVVWPPKELQETFSMALREVLQLCNASNGEKIALSLQASLSAHAFSGKLTANWREMVHDTLAVEVRNRDVILKGAGVSQSLLPGDKAGELEDLLQIPVEGIYSDLNREQRHLLRDIERRAWREDDGYYFTAESLAFDMNGPLHRHSQRIESYLSLFAVRGLIIPVSRPRTDNAIPTFAACYRLPFDGPRVSEDEQDSGTGGSDDIRAALMEAQRNLAKRRM